MAQSTREKLIAAASEQFRSKGYAASAVADILKAAGVPKGSLYHHFPGGKHDLALAATQWGADQILAIMQRSFDEAALKGGSFNDGVVGISAYLADIFNAQGLWDFCPITGTLLSGELDEVFRAKANDIFSQWRVLFIEQAIRFGCSEEEAVFAGEGILMLLQGAWIMARARNSADPIREAATYATCCLNPKTEIAVESSQKNTDA